MNWRLILAIEVANVNATLLVGEVCRLYFDCCPIKLMILGDRNLPRELRPNASTSLRSSILRSSMGKMTFVALPLACPATTKMQSWRAH